MLERVVAAVVLIAVCMYCVASVNVMLEMDWSQTETLYELIYRALVAVIGLELVRMLVTHSLASVVELIAFIISRRMLKQDMTSLDIATNVVALVTLLIARYYFMHEDSKPIFGDRPKASPSPASPDALKDW